MRQAAEQLHVSPSALSRTVSLVESDLSSPLFRREGRGLTLTKSGQTLLHATRDAMRLIHDALARIDSTELGGDLRISSPGTLTRMFLLPALRQLQSDHPDLRPHVSSMPTAELAESLRRGTLDLVLSTEPVQDDALDIRTLGHYASSVYCGVGHPLFEAKHVDLQAACAHAFVAPPPDLRGHPREGWPVEIPRRVELRAADLQVGLEVCRAGQHLAVLPDRIAAADVARGELRKLDIDVVPPTPFFAIRRPPLQAKNPADLLLERVIETIE